MSRQVTGFDDDLDDEMSARYRANVARVSEDSRGQYYQRLDLDVEGDYCGETEFAAPKDRWRAAQLGYVRGYPSVCIVFVARRSF